MTFITDRFQGFKNDDFPRNNRPGRRASRLHAIQTYQQTTVVKRTFGTLLRYKHSLYLPSCNVFSARQVTLLLYLRNRALVKSATVIF